VCYQSSNEEAFKEFSEGAIEVTVLPLQDDGSVLSLL